jgi:chorismate mutase
MKQKLKQLENLRRKINQVDQKLLGLLSERQKWSKEIAKFKKALKMPAFQPEREKAHRKVLLGLGKKLKLSPAFIGKLTGLLFKESRRIQK